MTAETKATVASVVALVAVFISAMTVVKYFDSNRMSRIDATNHIKVVIATDRNCNDCHLGNSFVNLFNHPVVKGNDNTIRLMMDKANIKRW